MAAEVGPALRVPTGTARRRVEDAVYLAEMLPEVLAALLGEHVPVADRLGLSCPPQLEGPEDAEPRSAGELRADVLAGLLLDGILPDDPGFPRGVLARVSVTVPVAVLTGGGAGAGAAARGVPMLSGFGPISAEVARRLAALCGQHHWVTHRDGHLGRWSVRRVAAGSEDGAAGTPSEQAAVLAWTSPGGLVHRSTPEHAGGRCAFADRRRMPTIGWQTGDLSSVGPADDAPPF